MMMKGSRKGSNTASTVPEREPLKDLHLRSDNRQEEGLDTRAPRLESNAVERLRTVAMSFSQLADSPYRVVGHDCGGPRCASSRPRSFSLRGRGVFRPLPTARS